LCKLDFVLLRVSVFLWLLFLSTPRADESAVVALPSGVKAVWDLEKAYREMTPGLERVCLNGLWNWRPAIDAKTQTPPAAGWGWFKVPGPWPGISDYMQKDCQTLYAHPDWKGINLGGVTAAWHQREIFIPANWSGRQIVVEAEYLNSFATVFIDGKRAGEMRFPAGEVDVTLLCEPGKKHTLTMLVVAMPLKGVLLSYTDSASAREVKGSVARRGLCGDVFLTGRRTAPRLGQIKIETSVRNGEIKIGFNVKHSVGAASEWDAQANIRVEEGKMVQLRAHVSLPAEADEATVSLKTNWKAPRLWDLHTATNQYELVLNLLDESGKMIDSSAPRRFGFREFWIDGRDFYLNGSRIFLSAVPLDNAEVGAAWATYDAARESLERLKSFGINFVYTHNYGCEPGSHLSFDEILRAADDVGMLVALSQPHFSHYDWKGADADTTNGYAEHARFYAKVAGNHPSVVFYSMSHNATGYDEDMNPDLIDGVHDPRDQWASNNAKLALRAEAIVKRIDPARIVYHHASGNLGVMHDMNFYPNFAPIQELSDWFGHWSTNGVKPVFMCEYGAPFAWDWTMYRGWYKGQREFGSARVPWEFCLAEWNAQFIGDRAFQISDAEKANLRWEATQFRAGNVWHRWDYPTPVGSSRFDETYPIHAAYLADNFRSFRAWGVSGISPWEHEHFWKLREGVNKARKDFKTDWENLQRPGFSPDYLAQRYERMDLAFERSDWIATEAARALLRNNRPLLAFIGGSSEAGFTSKDHNFFPGETVEKQLIVINNSRERIPARWVVTLPTGEERGLADTTIETGQQEHQEIAWKIPETIKPGKYELKAIAHIGNGEVQEDRFEINVLSVPEKPKPKGKIALFDVKGETAKWLLQQKIPFDLISDSSNLNGYEILIVGKLALSPDGPAPDISTVHSGLKVLIFEQSSQALEKRFGFRVQEYGLRNIIPRIPDHPLLRDLTAETLRDWRGSATLIPEQLKYETRPRYGPTVQWCDIPVPRLWRCGNRGNVASVLIEKPVRGNFLPIIDGGFDLQYSPLLEYREGKGLVVFCQLDVTGRTEEDPAAKIIADNLLNYVSTWEARPGRGVVYAGEAAGAKFLESIGVNATPFDAVKLDGRLLVIGPGGAEALAAHKSEIASFIDANGAVLAMGLSETDANKFLPFKITAPLGEHISTYFKPQPYAGALAGVGPADTHVRDPRAISLIQSGASAVGDGVLATGASANVVFCQLVPWQFEGEQDNLRRTRRRVAFLVSRLLANLGAEATTPLLQRFHTPTGSDEKRFLTGFYSDKPEEWDDPYRHFRW
jgi:beta-galactosidase